MRWDRDPIYTSGEDMGTWTSRIHMETSLVPCAQSCQCLRECKRCEIFLAVKISNCPRLLGYDSLLSCAWLPWFRTTWRLVDRRHLVSSGGSRDLWNVDKPLPEYYNPEDAKLFADTFTNCVLILDRQERLFYAYNWPQICDISKLILRVLETANWF